MRIHLVVATLQYLDGPVIPLRAFRKMEDAEAYVERHGNTMRDGGYAIYTFEVD